MECKRCLYEKSSIMPSVVVGDTQCNACDQHDELCAKYPEGIEGLLKFKDIVKKIKRESKHRRYDCVVGISGGCDSSYMLYRCVEAGLACLPVHINNGWDTDIATNNMVKMCKALNLTPYALNVKPDDYDEMVRAFLRAGLRDIEAPADIGLAGGLYRVASDYGIKYIMEGHNFRTEGISPFGMLYFDGLFVENVVKRYGTTGKLPASYTNLKFWDMVWYMGLKGITKIRPLYYLSYNKAETKKFLTEKFGWQDYGAHHGENKLTAYFHDWFMPKHCGINTRILGWAALVRSGQITKEEGKRLVKEWEANTCRCDESILKEIEKRLPETSWFEPRATWKNFKNYKDTFRRTKLLWWVLMKMGRVSESFYGKYCT